MRKHAVTAAAFAFMGASLIWASPAISAEQPSRQVLIQKDAPGGQTMTMVAVTIPVGAREGVHTHPGQAMVYVMSGAITLDYQGQPTVTYKAGETFYVEANHVHEGINKGSVPAIAVATFLTAKGQPMTTQVK